MSVEDFLDWAERQPGRYELIGDGQVMAFSEYTESGNTVVLTHTEVMPDYEGKGLASRLVRQVLDEIHDQHKQVAPVCPLVARYIRTHTEYQILVEPRNQHMLEK